MTDSEQSDSPFFREGAPPPDLIDDLPHSTSLDAKPEQSDSEMTDEARQHLRDLVVHRPDYDELKIVLHPGRCALCAGLAESLLGRVENTRS